MYSQLIIFTLQHLFDAYLKNSKCIAIIAQLAPTYGLRRSPILLIFQKKPVTPVRFSLVSPGCNVCIRYQYLRYKREVIFIAMQMINHTELKV